MAAFGRDFGQKVDLISRIRQALQVQQHIGAHSTSSLTRSPQVYPAGVSMFKEFIQNADDAGARRMHICLDLRSHPAAQTAWKQNAEDLQVFRRFGLHFEAAKVTQTHRVPRCWCTMTPCLTTANSTTSRI